MVPAPRDPYRDTLSRILAEAGSVALDRFGGVRAMAKSDGTQVTAADTEVEEVLVAALRRAFPEDGVVCEEGTVVEGGPSTWYVDPIDGTSAYVEGLAHWGPTLARVTDGVIEVGALYLPRLNELWYARRGGGAWRNGTRLAPGDPGSAGRHHAMLAPSRFHRSSPIPWPGKVRALGSTAAHLALVGAGSALVTIIPEWQVWDVAFGVLLVEEAGRRVCDAHGDPVDVTSCRPGLPILAGASTALDGLVRSGWTTSTLR